MPIFGSWSGYPNTTLDGGELDVSDYTRLIELFEPDGTTLIDKLSDYSDSTVGFLVTDASFELNRFGGCGAGSLEIVKIFNADRDIDVGQYIRMSYKAGDVWYFGRIEEVEYTAPATCSIRTYGLWSQLSDVIIGGNDGDYRPYLLARSDWFTNDPDYSFQTWITASDYVDAVTAIYNDWIQPRFPLITLGPVEFPDQDELFGYASMKFRGQETVGQVIRSLATMHKYSAFGVDENNEFFCIASRNRVLAEYTEGLNCQSISLKKDRSLLYTRLLITGDYVYGMQIQPYYYRYRVVITNKDALATYGNKKASVHLPWVRTNDQAADFASSFFARYSQVSNRATLQTKAQSSLLKPWLGNLKLKDSAGNVLLTDNLSSLKCAFNAVPTFDLVVGPEDLQWPEPPQPERWEIPKDKGDLSSNRNRGPSSESLSSFSSASSFSYYVRPSYAPGCQQAGVMAGARLKLEPPGGQMKVKYIGPTDCLESSSSGGGTAELTLGTFDFEFDQYLSGGYYATRFGQPIMPAPPAVTPYSYHVASNLNDVNFYGYGGWWSVGVCVQAAVEVPGAMDCGLLYSTLAYKHIAVLYPRLDHTTDRRCNDIELGVNVGVALSGKAMWWPIIYGTNDDWPITVGGSITFDRIASTDAPWLFNPSYGIAVLGAPDLYDAEVIDCSWAGWSNFIVEGGPPNTVTFTYEPV